MAGAGAATGALAAVPTSHWAVGMAGAGAANGALAAVPSGPEAIGFAETGTTIDNGEHPRHGPATVTVLTVAGGVGSPVFLNT